MQRYTNANADTLPTTDLVKVSLAGLIQSTVDPVRVRRPHVPVTLGEPRQRHIRIVRRVLCASVGGGSCVWVGAYACASLSACASLCARTRAHVCVCLCGRAPAHEGSWCGPRMRVSA